MATVSIFGLGYVGAALAGCLAENGHRVIGVDANPGKTDMIAKGHSPIQEKGLKEMIQKGVQAGLLEATTDFHWAALESEISVICVGTPSSDNGSPNLTYITRVSEQIGSALGTKRTYHVVAVRSTVPPGTTEKVIIPTLERISGKLEGKDFGVCFNPEFLREGTSIADFYDPPYTIIGARDKRAAFDLSRLYAMLTAPVLFTSFKVAEMLKFANNAFHALKVCFANEIGNICHGLGIDSHEVMEIFCADKKLNLSSSYLKPGFAFGGSCVPKDLRSLVRLSRHLDLSVPVLESILPSNRQQIDIACEMVERTHRRKVGILGFSFKPGTDDLRESAMVRLIEFLIGKGHPVKVYDQSVSLERLHGANLAYIEQAVPHIASVLARSLDEVVVWSEVIVIGSCCAEVRAALEKVRPDQVVIDVIRVLSDASWLNGNYHGICW
jgi:GDP-mannose 6-dehydrogenase